MYKRREFLKMAGLGGMALGGMETGMTSRSCAQSGGVSATGRDAYGGCTKIRFEATGHFRLEKTNRWWLVTPSGHAYLSFGLNHAELKCLQRGYNKAFWARRFNLPEDARNTEFQAGFEQKLKADMEAFGFTTLGTHSPTRAFSDLFANDVVNVRMVDICHYQTPTEDDFRDVFSDDFVKHCDQRARDVCAPRRDDPRVLGYTLTDCPILTEPESWPHVYNIYGWERPQVPTWPRVLRNKPHNSPGKQAYVATMRQIYQDNIERFNHTYNTAFESFGGLLRAVNWRRRSELDNRRESRDNATFLLKVIDRCYEVEVAAIRKHDPNHLVFGDKFQGNRMGLSAPTEHIALCAKHFDLILFQKYATWHDLEPLLDQCRAYGAGKPCYLGDGSINVPNEHMPDPFGPHCANQEIRARAFREACYGSFARNDFVGWDWCGWMDLWISDPENLKARDPRHAGVQDPFGNYNQPMQQEMRVFSENLYDIGTGNTTYAG
jgi:agarase